MNFAVALILQLEVAEVFLGKYCFNQTFMRKTFISNFYSDYRREQLCTYILFYQQEVNFDLKECAKKVHLTLQDFNWHISALWSRHNQFYTAVLNYSYFNVSLFLVNVCGTPWKCDSLSLLVISNLIETVIKCTIIKRIKINLQFVNFSNHWKEISFVKM